MSRWLIPMLGLALLFSACGDDSSTPDPDTGVDGAPPIVDMAPESDGPVVTPDGPVVTPDGPVVTPDGPVVTPDGPVVTPDGPVVTPDMGVDGPVVTPDGPVGTMDLAPTPDGPVGTMDMAPTPDSAPTPDGPVVTPDMGTSGYKVLYSANTSSTKYTLNQVMTDGSGQQVVSGLSADLDICSMYLAGPNGYSSHMTGIPTEAELFGEDNVKLPNGHGRLFRFYDGTNYGLMQITAAGESRVLIPSGLTYSGATCSSGVYIGVTQDGTMGVAVLNDTQLVLVRLDGTTWSGTSSYVKDVSGPSWTITQASFSSMIVGKESALFRADEQNGDQSVYAVKLDGSGTATKLTLPQTSGAATNDIETYMAVSNDGMTFAFVGGTSSTDKQVFVYKDGASPTVTVVSPMAADWEDGGNYFMDGGSPQLAVSPAGTMVAIILDDSTSVQGTLYVVTSDGVTQTEVGTDANFDPTVDDFGEMYWADEDNLLFWAGVTTTNQSLFHYKVSTGAVTALAGTSATAVPYGAGTFDVDGGWVSQNGGYIYYVAGDTTTAMDIVGVNLSTFATVAVTSGLDVSSSSVMQDDYSAAGSKVFFLAKVSGASPLIENIYMFDENAPAAATQITNLQSSTTLSVYSLLASPDGSWVSYSLGSGSSETLYVVEATGSGTPVPINGAGGSYIEDAHAWTPDGAAIVYQGGSTSSSALDLFLVDVATGVSTTLHATQSYGFVFGVY